MGERPDAKVLRHRLPQIRERLTCPDVDALSYVESGFSRPTCNQQWDILARMIRARRTRIVAMVGGDHEQVGRAKVWQHSQERGVKPFKVRSIAGDIIPVAIHGIEVNKVDKK